MGVCVPEEYGGAGADFLSYMLVLEELSRGDAGVGVTVAVHTSAVTLPILALRHRRAARALRAAARARRADRRVRADRGGGGLGRGLAAHLGDRGERRRLAHLRREAVHLDGGVRRHVPALRAHRPGHARRARRLGLHPRRRPHPRHRPRGEARAQLVGHELDRDRGRGRRAPTGCCTRRARASTSRWRRSTAAGSGSPRRRSGSRRPRTTSRATTRSSGKQFGKPIAEFQAIQ